MSNEDHLPEYQTLDERIPDGFVSLPLVGETRQEMHVNTDDIALYGPETEYRMGIFRLPATPVWIRGRTEPCAVALSFNDLVRRIVTPQRQRKTVHR